MNRPDLGPREPPRKTAGKRLAGVLGWTYAAYAVEFALAAAALAFLARLLTPYDFGVLSVGVLVVGFAEAASRLGLGVAVVQHPRPEAHLHAAWTGHVLSSCLVVAVLQPLVPAVCRHFEMPEATRALRALLLVVPISALISAEVPLLRRALRTRELMQRTLVRAVVQHLGAVLLAVWLRSYWAMVWARLVAVAAEAVVSHAMAAVPLRLEWAPAKWLELYRFSRWVQLGNGLKWASTHLDSAALGSLLGPHALGAYNRSLRLAVLLEQPLFLLSSQVVFPVFSKLCGDPARASRVALPLVVATAAVACLGATLLGLFPAPVVELALGQGWSAAAATLPLLSLAVALRALSQLQVYCLRGLGRSNSEVSVRGVRIVCTALGLIGLVPRQGAVGAALAVLLGEVAAWPLACWSWSRALALPTPTVLATVGAVACSFGLSSWLVRGAAPSEPSALAALGLSIVAGAGAVAGLRGLHCVWPTGPWSSLTAGLRLLGLRPSARGTAH